MTNRFYSPDQQFINNDGTPLAGGQLFFYATGSSTLQATYSDQALSVANTNPVVLDSNGYAGSIFLQNLAYKVVLEDSNNNQIWTMDPVYTSDYSTYAAFQPWNGNPNGQVAGFAGTVGALPPTSAIWDYVDNILYICTTTGNAATAVWTAVNANSVTQLTPAPQGYLTLNNDPSNPILTTDASAATTVYYTPLVGNVVPIYNGASFVTTVFTQLSLALTASQALNTIYDVFVFNNLGVLTLVTGPAWATSTAGSGSRGSGAGTTQLQRLNGLWVNAVQITGRNGATSYTIPANTATYLGTILIDGTAGQVTCTVSYGTVRKWGVWNAYNRQTIYLQEGDPAASWSTTTSFGPRSANGNANNTATILIGLPEETVLAGANILNVMNYNVSGTNLAYTTTFTAHFGIGVNTTAGWTGQFGTSFYERVWNVTVVVNGDSYFWETTITSNISITPFIGSNVLNAVESIALTGPATLNGTNFGTSTNMLMYATYRG